MRAVVADPGIGEEYILVSSAPDGDRLFVNNFHFFSDNTLVTPAYILNLCSHGLPVEED